MIDKMWEAEKYALSKITITFLPRRMPVKDAGGGEIGYTNQSDGIFIAREHEIFNDLPTDEKRFFRKGVFAHELLHQIFTDFHHHNIVMKTIAPAEKSIFALFANILEDPAIEYWAKTKFGGSLLKSLKFSIAHVYKKSENIESSKDPFSQYISAMIQFGDMGLVKGHFTFPEAKSIFMQTAPMFNQGVLEPCGAKRLMIAKQIMEASRPLWEEQVKEQEELNKLLSDLMKSFGKEMMKGSGKGEDGDADAMPEGVDGKSKRRSSVIEKMKDGEREGDAGSGDSDPDSSESSESTSSEKGSSSDKKEDGSSMDTSKGSTKGGKSAPDKAKDDCDGEKDGASGEKRDESKSGESDFDTSTGDVSSDSCEEKMTEEDAEEMRRELEKAEEEMKKEKAADERDDSSIPTESLKLDKCIVPESRILNKRSDWRESNSRQYADIVSSMSSGIENTTRQLRRLLTIAQEDTEYATRGKININRLNCGKSTARVFDRKKIPSNIADLAVGIAVDLSGSMNRDARIVAAKKCCIALSEIFGKLNIPVYIMGFTGDIGKYTIMHEHYVTWKNAKKDRECLVNICAMSENYDGASIRCFTKIMQKKNARHKLLIVISDGQPCGPGYYGESANKDTALAIKEARKVSDVLGVAVGNDNTEILHSFYGGDFLHVDTPSDLFAKLSLKLKKFVKKWIDEQ